MRSDLRGSGVANERLTEAIVRKHFEQDITNLPEGRKLLIEEQKSSDPLITRALQTASKRGAGLGRPEFIIRDPNAPQFVVVVECKASTKQHASPNLDRATDYAVDGVLNYAAHLSHDHDVVAVGVSGTSIADLRVSTYMWRRGEDSHIMLTDSAGPITKLLPFHNLRNLMAFDPSVRDRTLKDLMAFSHELHDYMRDYAKVSEPEKPLLVGGILIALKDNAFRSSWRNFGPKELARQMYDAIQREAENTEMDGAKQRVMLQPFSFIPTHPELSRPIGAAPDDSTNTPLRRLVMDLDYR